MTAPVAIVLREPSGWRRSPAKKGAAGSHTARAATLEHELRIRSIDKSLQRRQCRSSARSTMRDLAPDVAALLCARREKSRYRMLRARLTTRFFAP
jgi:hypothetical protein